MPRRRKAAGDPKRVVGYVRVSTDEQTLSPDAQKDALKAWCRQRGCVLVAIYESKISTRVEVHKRRALLDAIGSLQEHNAGSLLVLRQDRLARDVAKFVVIERMVEEQGARVLACDGVGNESNPQGELMKTIVRAFAQYERAAISMRTSMALQSKKRRGDRYTCRAPYGKEWTKDGQCVDCPREVRSIARILELRADGYPMQKICDELNANRRRYRPRGKKWHLTTVARILRRCEELGLLQA